MSGDGPEVAAARIEADRARARLMDTARELQERLSPGTLAKDAWEGAKSKGADWAEDAVDAVQRRPAIAAGVVAAVALFFARKPLLDLTGKLAGEVKAKARKGKARPRKTKTRQKATETTE